MSEQRSAWVKTQSWKVAIQHKWQERQHIDLLQCEEFIIDLRWYARTGSSHGREFIILCHNQSLNGALNKGSSSKPTLSRICRRVAALLLVLDMTLKLF